MPVFKCKMCGGTLEVHEGMTVCECEYCGSTQTVPSLDDEKKINLFTRANRLRSACEFDKASGVYESLVSEFQEEAEAYWGLILCKYGIEYVDDPRTGRKIPTCHRSSFDSVFDDPNFELVMEYSDATARAVYRDEAKVIEEIRAGIIEVSSKEDPYDIFICYKETDAAGDRTIDSVIAQEVYDVLTEKGYKVFFSRITLEDKLGQEYEPYIFAALNSAKIMLAFGTDYEYYNAVWVKNEWSRFLSLIENGAKKTLIPCFKGIDAYDMPKEFARLQAQDMGKVGAIQDLVRGIGKILGTSKPVAEIHNITQGESSALVQRGLMALEDEDFNGAEGYFERALDINPSDAYAYLGKFLALHSFRSLQDWDGKVCKLEDDKEYRRAEQFADANLAKQLKEAKEFNELKIARLQLTDALKKAWEKKNTECINERNEKIRLRGIYSKAKNAMNEANTEYAYETAIAIFNTIAGFDDVDEQIRICKKKVEEIKAKDEANRLKEEEHRIASEKVAKKRKKVFTIFASIVCACILLVLILTKVIIPLDKYDSAMELYNVEKYQDAYIAFNEVSYKDSKEKASECLFLGQKQKLSSIKEGNTIKFGLYEQDNDTANGKEEIEWIVLNVESSKALVISKYAIDCRQYNGSIIHGTWEECSLREWLNDSFLNAAFSSKHQDLISSVRVSTDKNPEYGTNSGHATNDKVFILSVTEAEKYFPTDESRSCISSSYAKAQGGYTNAWWLRTLGFSQYYAAIVKNGGSVDCTGSSLDSGNVAVRPALWINLDN